MYTTDHAGGVALSDLLEACAQWFALLPTLVSQTEDQKAELQDELLRKRVFTNTIAISEPLQQEEDTLQSQIPKRGATLIIAL